MASYRRNLAIAALLTTSVTLIAAQSGSGTTTRYWDCCKPSCAWNGIAGLTNPVISCGIDDKPLKDATTQSGCAGGSAYMCSNQSPWAVNDNLAYGFAAVTSANPTCCQCYQLTFTSGPISGKQMIVQATNTGTDVGSSQFDIAASPMPGGGFGIFDGCSNEWGATSAVWGAQYGGPSTNTCSSFPVALQPGCDFRWDWMEGASNPTVNWEMVTCPAAIVAVSGCSIAGQTPTGPSSVSSVSVSHSSTSIVAPVSSPHSSSSTVAPVVVSTSSFTSSTKSVPTPSSSHSSSSSSSMYVVPVAGSSAKASAYSSTTATVPKSTATTLVSNSVTKATTAPSPTATGTDDESCEL